MAKASSNKDIAQSGKRKPRVHIQYQTYTGDAMRVVSLPFVMGVLADLSGQTKPDKALKDRKFVDFSAQTFDARMKDLKPSVSFDVDNKLTKEGGALPVKITFESMKDFTPEGIAKKVEPLRKLLEMRDKLTNLEANLDGKDTRELDKIVNDPQVLSALSALPGAKDDAKAGG